MPLAVRHLNGSELLGAETIRHKDEGPPGKAFRAFALARWILDKAQERVIIPIFGTVCADLIVQAGNFALCY